MKSSRASTYTKVHQTPHLRFDDQRLTSYAGLIVIQKLFAQLQLKDRLLSCFQHVAKSVIIDTHLIVLLLVVHIIVGGKRLRDIDYYKDDLMMLRLLGLRHIPDVATISRRLERMDAKAIERYRSYLKELIKARLQMLSLGIITLDCDGSVIGTQKHAEGTTVGYNKKKKGQRSYYPLFCTIAQTDQVLDFYHRAGNVHDSNGARQFMVDCIQWVRSVCPRARMELRGDSAFFSDEIVDALDVLGVEFSISVPFERFAELKAIIENRQRWRRLDGQCSYCDRSWKPKCWANTYRFLFMRQKVKEQRKEPIQLDLFVPHQYGYDFKVIVTNKKTTIAKILRFHNGRGAQEKIFSELKSEGNLGYVPVRKKNGNIIYINAHN